MSVSNGQLANQTTFNTAFMSRTVDTSTAGKVDLANAAAASGATVTNAQREINGLGAYTGRASGGTFDSTPTYANNNVVENGDTLTQAISELDAEFSPTSGSLASRAGRTSISNGSATLAVTFSTAFADALYVIDHCLENTTDADPIFLQGVITARSTTGFTMRFNAPADSANYVLNWSVRKPYNA